MQIMAAVYSDRMKVPTCLLANDAAVTDNTLLNVAGGGWEHFATPRFPASITGWLTGLFELEPVERGTDQIVRMSIVDRDGTHLSSQSFIVNETSRLVPFAKQFSVVVEAAGTIKVDLSVDGQVLCSTPCEVKLIEP